MDGSASPISNTIEEIRSVCLTQNSAIIITNCAQLHPWCSSRYLAALGGGGGSRGVPVVIKGSSDKEHEGWLVKTWVDGLMC